MNRIATIALGLMTFLSGAQAQGILPDEQRTNGVDMLKAAADLRNRAAAASVQLGKTKDKTLTGIILSPDGYLLTQASDAEPLKPLRAFLPDGAETEVREVKRDDRLNLLLLKIERGGLQAIAWGESLSVRAGQWLTSLTNQGREVRLGVASAKRRAIPNSGAVLGVRFGVDDDDAGVIVEELAEDSPAQKAGLRADDVILYVNSESVAKNASLAKIIAAHRPGDVVKIRYSREGKETECEVRLVSKRHVLMNWDGEDFANHGTSIRTDNFPEIIQHDLPLSPADMGGAVFDLQGRAIAVNIARVDRVTNYALPVETFLPDMLRWMREDRVSSPKSKVQGRE